MNNQKEDVLNEYNIDLITEEEIEGDDDFTDELDEGTKLVIEKIDPTISTLWDKFKRGKLDLQPSYQRKFVMKKTTSSRLIESIILEIPIPVVYLSEEDNNVWQVIDGQQRLTSIISFLEGYFLYDKCAFKLSGLKVLTNLNGKSFKDLDSITQEKIRDTAIRAIVIKNGSDENIKFEVFERLNTGSTPLNEDEIRNTLYRGKYIDLLSELEEDPTFNKIVNKPNFLNRMIYRGMILRFFCLL